MSSQVLLLIGSVIVICRTVSFEPDAQIKFPIQFLKDNHKSSYEVIDPDNIEAFLFWMGNFH